MIRVRHKKGIGDQEFILFHPNLVCCLNQMLAVTELSQHLVSSSKTVRPIIPRGARCVGHVKIMWSTVCSLAPHFYLAEGARTHLCMDERKRPTPVRMRFSLTQAVLVKLIPIGLVLTLGMYTPSADIFLEYSVSHVKFVHWAARVSNSDKLRKFPRGRSKGMSRFQFLFASSLRLSQWAMQNVTSSRPKTDTN